MTHSEAIQLKPSQKIRVYDGCLQCDVIEKVVRVEENRAYNTVYIYSERENWIGYDERLSTPREIKELVKNEVTYGL